MKALLSLIALTIPFLSDAKNVKPAPTSAEIIVQWNQFASRSTKIARQNTNLASRILAIEAIAVYDAVNSITRTGTPYCYKILTPKSASIRAAVSQAAHDVLVNSFVNQKPAIDSLLTLTLQTTKDGDVERGCKAGAASAAAIISLRANDGSSPLTTYAGVDKPGVGVYRPTPGKFAPGVDVEWGKLKPFVLKDNKQFLPEQPPAINSDQYKKDLEEVTAIGSAKNDKRTEDQTHIAQFYKQDAELTVNDGLRKLVMLHQTEIGKAALIFALTDIAEADARIEVWGGKYAYLFWRPVTAINAEADGSVKDYSKWTPLIATPPHPSYPSGHSATITAGYEVLKHFYGDENELTLHTTTEGEPDRTVAKLSTIEYENGYSRVYGGIHYPFENTAAQNVGKKVAAFVLANGPRELKN